MTKDISTLTPPGQEYSVNAGDRIYFHTDAGTPKSSAEEASQKTRWNVKIHYTGVNMFEYLKDGAMFEPPLSGITDQFLKDTIYTTRMVNVPFGGQQEVTQLKDHWWLTLDEGTLAQVYDRLIDLGYFVPARVPRSTFETILNAASNDSIPLASQISVTSQVTHNTYAMPILKGDQAILAGFEFEPETNSFRWKRTETFTAPPVSSMTDSDQVFMHYMQGTSILVDAEKQAIALPASVASGAPVAVQQLDAASVGYVDRVTQSLPATLTVDGLQGNMLPDKGLLLETTYDAEGVPIERLWLRSAGGNPWSLVRESAKTGSLGQLTVDPMLPSVSLGASFVVGINDRGVARGFTFTGKSAAQQIPDAMYAQILVPSSWQVKCFQHKPTLQSPQSRGHN